MSNLQSEPFTAQIAAALSQLTVSRLRFELKLRDPLRLPPFAATMLRGGLGIRFRKLVCIQPQIKNCRDCMLLHACAFPAIFETPLPPGLPSAPHLQEVSPYNLRPSGTAAMLAAGDTLTL